MVTPLTEYDAQSGPSPKHGQKRDALAVAALLALVATLMWSRFWNRPGLGDWDIMTFYLPWYAHLGEALRALDVPGWNPFVFSGMPFAGDPQSGWTYVPAMFFFTVLPPAIGYKLFFAFHLALGGIAAFTLARLLGFGALSSFAAGAVFAAGQNLGATRCCTNHLQLVVWIPVGMIGVELMIRSTTRSQRFAALTVSGFAASQMVAGWVGQGAYNGFLILATYLVWRSLSLPSAPAPWRARVRRVVVDGAFVFGIGVGLSAAGLLPRLDAIRRTFLGTEEYQGASFAPDRGWDWAHVISVLMSFGLAWHPYYLGGAVVACAIAALATGRLSRGTAYFAVLVAILIILPGRPTPMHEFFYLLPRFRGLHLHDPGRVLAVLPIGVAILAAVVVSATARPLPRQRLLWLLFALVSGSWLALFLLDRAQPWSIAPITWVSFTASALLLLAWAIGSYHGVYAAIHQRRAWLNQVVPVALVLLILADPAGRVVADDLGVHPADAVLDHAIAVSAATTDPGGAGAFLQARQAEGELFRYYGYMDPRGPWWQGHEVYMQPAVLTVLANNRSMRLGLYDVQGYNPAQVERYRTLFEVVNGFERDYHEAVVYQSGLLSPMLDMLNVRYILVPTAMPPGQPGLHALLSFPEVFLNDHVRVLENPHALPRAWLVHAAQQVDYRSMVNTLAAPWFDPRRVVLLEEAAPPVQPAPVDAAETVTVTEYGSDRVRLDVTAATPGILVLADVYDPGWKAYVDGEETRVLTANLVLRGIAVPAGSHEVEFRYEPLSLRIGLIVSGVALLFVAVVVANYLWATRRRRGVPSPRTATEATS